MKVHMCFVIFLISLVFFFGACMPQERTSKVLEYAGDNRIELLKVLDHYRKENDSLKLKAAIFLIQNMPQHYTLTGPTIQAYAERIYNFNGTIDTHIANEWWKGLKEASPQFDAVYDIKTLKSDFLIHNIDKAFEIWEKTPWRKDVNFEMFVQYILPYRFQNEMLTKYWRDSLYEAYHPIIANVKDMKEAFTIIHDSILHQMGRGGFSFPFLLDVWNMRKQRRATCTQRCVFLGSVLRAVGIPVAIDAVERWANYSMNGHNWVTLISEQGSFSIANGDSIVRQHNAIDASLFPIKYSIKEDYPLSINFKKRTAKVRRITYSFDVKRQMLENEQKLISISSPFSKDVSDEYALLDTITIMGRQKDAYAYLCTFTTGEDWEPICYTKQIEGKYTFSNVGDSIVYLVAIYKNNQLVPINYPFVMLSGRKNDLRPDTLNRRRILLTRKYPLIGSFINNWGKLIGAKLEGSNHADFSHKDILHTVTEMPVFQNRIPIKTSQSYRYMRYVTPQGGSTPITELQYWYKGILLKGVPLGINAQKVERCFDNDTYTMLRQPKKEYMVGIDFGKPCKVDSIVYYPKNDGNFIVPGNEYELFYYDKAWVSLGKQTSIDFYLVYDDVPDNAILLLKNYTKGHEERIFTYENGRQIWW